MENFTLLQQINSILEIVVEYVWNLPLVILLTGAGLLLTFLLGFIQIKGFIHAIQVVRGKFDNPNDPGEISHFQALCTALSATVGLGNIAGVAVAIHLGGPGATFWMIVTGLLGMATKFAECTLAVKYRRIDAHGEVHGGPMHYISMGLGHAKASPIMQKFSRFLAGFFALACMCSALGAGNMFQTNQVAAIFDNNFQIPPIATGLTLAVLTGIVIIGGIKRIGHVTSMLVPLMGGIYIIGALIVILANVSEVPHMFMLIIQDAFTGQAVAGGFVGVLIMGVRRACFSNEAGLGSSPIAHSAAATNEPVREGTVALLEPFVDTVVICTMTALVILISGAWVEDLNGVELTAKAFNSAIPGFGMYFVPLAVALFAYSTLLSWSYYGERAFDYLFNSKGIIYYKIVFCIFAFLGAIWRITPVLSFSDIMLGLMVIPNVIALLLMMPQLRVDTRDYYSRLKRGAFNHD